MHQAWIYFRSYAPRHRTYASNTGHVEGAPRYASSSGSVPHDHGQATHHDPIWVRLVMAILVTVCSLGVLNNMILSWLYTVTHFGNFDYLQSQPWPFVGTSRTVKNAHCNSAKDADIELPSVFIAVFGILTGLSGCIVQMFLLTRLWKLMRNYLIAGLVIGMSFTSYGSGLWSCWILVNNSRYDERDTVRVSISLWLTLSAATDVVIAALLLWRLVKARQETIQFSQSAMSEPLKKLIILIIESGAAIAIVQTVGYVFFRIFESSNIPTALAMCLPSVYTLTALFNLNIRDALRRAMFKKQMDMSANVVVNQIREDIKEKRAPGSSNQRGSIASAILVSRTESQIVEEGESFQPSTTGTTRVRSSLSTPIVVPLSTPQSASDLEDAKSPAEFV
ncbi:hypothetical protein OIV83_006123 [Microbotryomycetes sp. JL201]|nr:hypothetical protein OIV83_006123 [Microbotryomycetes sp. JL201]